MQTLFKQLEVKALSVVAAFILLCHGLVYTILYPYNAQIIDYSLIFMSICGAIISIVFLIRLIIYALKKKFHSHIWQRVLVCSLSLVLTLFSAFFACIQTAFASPLIAVKTIHQQNYYIFDTSFLDPACRVDVQQGIFLVPLHPFDSHCDPQQVRIEADQQGIVIRDGNTILGRYKNQ